MASSVIPVINPDWLRSVQAESCLKNAKWYWNLSREHSWNEKIRDEFEAASWLQLLYWAQWRNLW